jgi:hypothetical protein
MLNYDEEYSIDSFPYIRGLSLQIIEEEKEKERN